MKSMAELVASVRSLSAAVAELVRVIRELTATFEHHSLSVEDGLSDLRRAVSPKLVTVPEFARTWGVSTSTVWRWANDGELPTVRIGRTVRIDMGKVHGTPAEGRPRR